MSDELHEILRSLAAVMADESAILRSPLSRKGVGELAGAKERLVARLTALLAHLERQQPGWFQELATDAREQLAETITGLGTTAEENAQVIRRQIELSEDLLDCVKRASAKRTGGNANTYGRSGMIESEARNAPLALNTNL